MLNFKFLYKNIFKPIVFRLDPEFVHDRILGMGILLGKFKLTKKLTHNLFAYSSPVLQQKILNINFPNPIGLAAGFDKNAQLTDILPEVGFGFAELGSITGEECEGNSKTRLWRLPKSKSLLVYYGLKNDGAQKIAFRLRKKTFKIPIGISVAKTNSQETVELNNGISDYVKAYKNFTEIGSYTTINISCPNAFGGEPFTDPVRLEALLVKIDAVPTVKPVFIKLSPDLDTSSVDAIIEVLNRHNIQGIICSNLTKNRNNENIKDSEIPTVGGFSGKVVEDLSNKLIEYVYKKTQGKYIIVGCGGVFNAEDAYKKIKLGASLIQMITGMIYEGPQVIGEINRGLVKLLERDGYKNVSEAIGVGNK